MLLEIFLDAIFPCVKVDIGDKDMSENSLLSAAQLSWDKLGFGEYGITGWAMYVAHYRDGAWQEAEFTAFSSIQMDPRAAVLNYGVGAFDGLKAQVTPAGRVALFRPLDNAVRLMDAAKRLRMPPFPAPRFCQAVEQVVKRSVEFIPPYGKGALYVRPLLFGSGYNLRLEPPKEFTFLVFSFPCGTYFGKPMRILADPKHPRAMPGGTGNVKSIANYSGDYEGRLLAKERGFDEVLHLDARKCHLPEEVGAANVFFVLRNGTIITPSLERGTILPGITRRSIIALARGLDYEVKEYDEPLATLITETSEIFCTGTAVGVVPVSELEYRNRAYQFHSDQAGSVTQRLRGEFIRTQAGEGVRSGDWLHYVPVD